MNSDEEASTKIDLQRAYYLNLTACLSVRGGSSIFACHSASDGWAKRQRVARSGIERAFHEKFDGISPVRLLVRISAVKFSPIRALSTAVRLVTDTV